MFDIGEICDLLRVENMCDVCAIAVPAHLNYVEHLVVATGASRRHLRAVASQVKKIVRLKLPLQLCHSTFHHISSYVAVQEETRP